MHDDDLCGGGVDVQAGHRPHGPEQQQRTGDDQRAGADAVVEAADEGGENAGGEATGHDEQAGDQGGDAEGGLQVDRQDHDHAEQGAHEQQRDDHGERVVADGEGAQVK